MFVSVVKECLDFSGFFCDPLLKYQVLNQANLVTSHMWIYLIYKYIRLYLSHEQKKNL